MRYTFAPLEGVTGFVYRNLHRRLFGGPARYYAPFLSVGPGRAFSPKEWQDICPEHNRSGDVTPQLLGKDAGGFLWAARELRAMGYREINFNLGCPSGTVTAKGKGAGFLARPAELRVFLDEIFSSLDGPISIKTRLGMKDPAEFPALLELFNRYPISELIVHPRVRQDFYRVPARREVLPAVLAQSKNPVGYNGDVLSLAGGEALASQFPGLRSIMIGRALIADPALLCPEKRTRHRLREFDERLFEEYCALFGNERNALMRMKEVWFYHIHLFEGGERLAKRLRRAAGTAEYRAVVEEIYRTLPLREAPVPGWQN